MISGKRVSTVLTQIAVFRGHPDRIVVNNGSEFIINAMDAWVYGVTPHFMRPGKPVDNA